MALAPEAIDKLRVTLSSLGWNDVIKPVIAQFGKRTIDALLTSPEARSGEFNGATDAEIRGEFKAYRRVLEFFEQEVRVFESNKVLEELEKKKAEAVRKADIDSE